MKWCSIFLWIGLVSAVFVPLTSMKQSYDTNAKMKSIFIYNFTKYIEWPQDYKSGDFIITVVGNSGVSKELISLATTKKAVNQNITVREISSPDEVGKSHIIFVAGDKSDVLEQIRSKANSTSTLLVTEKEGMVQKGSAINFIIRENRVKFELNKGSCKQHNLTVSSDLERLAVSIQ